MNGHVEELLSRARGPLGPSVQPDLGTTSGPLGKLAELLAHQNGFAAFNAGLQVFRAGPRGLGPELGHWNQRGTWKDTYGGLADGLFCFAQDLFGVQFAIVDNARVLRFDPETARQTELGDSLADWAAWLLADPDVRGTHHFATAWQDQHGPLDHHQRLIPLRFFALGGDYSFDNLVVKDAEECMRIRGPVAQRVHALPDSAHLRMRVE